MTTPALVSGTSGSGNPRKPWGAPREARRASYPQKATADTTVVQRPSSPHSAVEVTLRVRTISPDISHCSRRASQACSGSNGIVEHGGEHRRRQILGVVARGDLVLSVAVVLGDVAMVGRIGRHRQPDGRRHEAAGLVGGGLGDHGEDHLARLQEALPLFAIHQLTLGRKNGAHADQVVRREVRIAERHLEEAGAGLCPMAPPHPW